MVKVIKRLISRWKKKDYVAYLREQGAVIGDGCSIYSNVSFGSEPFLVKIGNNVRISSNTVLVTHDGACWVVRNIYPEYKNVDIFAPITIGDNVHIGTGVTIMPGVTIGDNVIVGCNAVVTRSIPSNSVAAGVPAKVIETVDEYVQKKKETFVHTKAMTIAEKRAYLERYWKDSLSK